MDVTFSTRRLILRQPRTDDAPRIARFLNNFRVAGNLARVPYPYHETDAHAWLASWRADTPPQQTGFVLDLPGEGLIGNCGFHLAGDGTPSVGYWLGEPFWNRGFMSEALAATVGWYFDATDAASIASGIFTFNKASLAIQKKVGFTEIGTSMIHCLARHEDVRHIDTQLTRVRWAARQAAAPAKVAL